MVLPPFTPEDQVSGSLTPTELRLAGILYRVNDWKRYSEQQHNGAILLGVAGLALLVSLAAATTDPNPRYLMGAGGLIVVLGLIISIASYFPASDVARRLSGPVGRPHPDDNLYEYEHIAKYEPSEFVHALEGWYLDPPLPERPASRSERDLAASIIHDARMTVCKVRLFGYSLLLYGIAAVLVTVAALVALMDR